MHRFAAAWGLGLRETDDIQSLAKPKVRKSLGTVRHC